MDPTTGKSFPPLNVKPAHEIASALPDQIALRTPAPRETAATETDGGRAVTERGGRLPESKRTSETPPVGDAEILRKIWDDIDATLPPKGPIAPEVVQQLASRICIHGFSLSAKGFGSACSAMLLKLGRDKASPELLQAMLKPLLQLPALQSHTADAGLDAICRGLGGPRMKDEHFRLIARHKLLALNHYDHAHPVMIALRGTRIAQLLSFVSSREDPSAALDWMHKNLCDPAFPLADRARAATYRACMEKMLAPDASPQQALATGFEHLRKCAAVHAEIESTLAWPAAARAVALSPPATKDKAFSDLIANIIDWAAGQPSDRAARALSGLAPHFDAPDHLAKIVAAIARAPAALEAGHVRQMCFHLLGRTLHIAGFKGASDNTIARLIKSAFMQLESHAASLSDDRMDAMTDGLFGTMSEAVLLSSGPPLLARAVSEGVFQARSLEAMAKAFVSALTKPVDAAALTPLFERLDKGAAGAAGRVDTMRQALLHALAEAGTSEVDRKALTARETKTGSTTQQTTASGVEALFAKASHMRPAKFQSACVALFRQLGGGDMGNWSRLAILDEGMAAMQETSRRSLREQADAWITPLVQQSCEGAGSRDGLRFILNHILASRTPLTLAINDAVLDATCAAVVGMQPSVDAAAVFKDMRGGIPPGVGPASREPASQAMDRALRLK